MDSIIKTTTRFLFIVSLTLWSQTTHKKPVTVADYNRWGTMYKHNVSDDGNWVSFLIRYDESPDTLFVKQVYDRKTIRILNAVDGKFWDKDKYVYLDRNKTLHIVDLDKDMIKTITNVSSFSISGNDNYLVTQETKEDTQHLVIRNTVGQEIERIENIQSLSLNHKEDQLIAIISKNAISEIVIIDLGVKIKKMQITKSSDRKFSNLVWSDNDQSIAFFNSTLYTNSIGISHYQIKEKSLKHFDQASFEDVFSDYSLSDFNNNLFISSDNERVFFTIIKKTDSIHTPSKVQIWNSNDVKIYPENKLVEDFESNTRVMTWNPKTNKLISITDKERPYCLINPTKDFALTYNNIDLGPQYKMNPNVNYHVKNLKTGESELLLKNQITTLESSALSPHGQYFAYLDDGDWWVYNFEKKAKSIITSNAQIQTLRNDDPYGEVTYGFAGWGQNDTYLLLYDKYDIWKISFDGTKPIRLTKGREQKVVYRIPRLNKDKYSEYYGKVDPIVDTNQDILLSAEGENKTGYFLLHPSGDLEKMVFDEYYYENAIKANKSNNYVFQYQKYDSPPGLISYNDQAGTTPFFQSNKHHYDYLWGKQEIINYKNSKGNRLKGILYYPADYDPNKKYPMVVSIYENQNYLKNYYFNPTIYNPAGLNVTTLNAQGYFVLLPDIVYEMGNPGISATDCVVSATNKVISLGHIMKDKIALMGQSFGGYETNFIITQTSLFKTAISSASVFDLNSFYLSISQNNSVPEHWRFESQQWRMGKSLFEDKEMYDRNSPLTYVDKTNTSVLIWTGEDDRQINPNQSFALYLALRRLKKEAIMLVYPKESHSLWFKENQKDLYFRVQDWLAYYLKDEIPAKWISVGL